MKKRLKNLTMTVDPNWTYRGKVVKELPEDCEAFVYLITNIITHQKYVGKKLAKSCHLLYL